MQENSHKTKSVTIKNEVDDICGLNEINPIFPNPPWCTQRVNENILSCLEIPGGAVCEPGRSLIW